MTDPKANLDVLDTSDIVAERPNRDPLTGAPGAHLMGVGVGAATAGAVGGVIGSVLPVVGTAIGVTVGTAVGALVGGYAGKGAAEVLFPTEEERYWREQHRTQAETVLGAPYTFDQDYLAAYRFGYINSHAYGDMDFEEVEDQMHAAWEESRDASRLSWREARDPARLAWDRARAHVQGKDRENESRP